ncbi:MAG: hypothetical protein JWO89_1928 [Verrucomicrobiaceae bacterium]|nr:hypothetical protein [Verrucomicrobiaceae bacterium]
MKDDESASPSPSPQQCIVELASAILNGGLGIIEGSRRICNLQGDVSSLDHDPDFLPFVVIDSETDHFPIGETRQHWAPESLVLKDREIVNAESFYQELAFAGCRRLLERYEIKPTSPTHNV